MAAAAEITLIMVGMVGLVAVAALLVAMAVLVLLVRATTAEIQPAEEDSQPAAAVAQAKPARHHQSTLSVAPVAMV